MAPIWQVLFKENFGMKLIIEASDVDESFSDSQDQEIIVIMERNYQDSVRMVKLFGKLIEKVKDDGLNALIQEIENNDKPFELRTDFLIQVIPQSEFQSKPCYEWRLHPSKILILLYTQFLPLDRKFIDNLENPKIKRDLSELILPRAENASRPVDYWFLPNKYWDVVSFSEDEITIQATSNNKIISRDKTKEQQLILPARFFVRAMANSLKDYQEYPPIIPDDAEKDFFLVYKNEMENELEDYYEWGQQAHKQGLVGGGHSGRTPYLYTGGIVTKINYLNVKTIALRFSPPIVGRRILRNGFFGNEEVSDLFFAYLTSSIFFLDLMEKSRTRCAEFVKIEYIDLVTLFRFPDLSKIMSRKKICKQIIDASKEFNSTPKMKARKRLIDVISDARINQESNLRKLDEAWLIALGIPVTYLDALYQEIDERLKDIIQK